MFLTKIIFLEIAKSYPIGLIKIDGETVIRDPFKVMDTTIHFLDLIDSGQYFSIMARCRVVAGSS